MPPSPYTYSRPGLPLASDVWEPLKPAATTPRAAVPERQPSVASSAGAAEAATPHAARAPGASTVAPAAPPREPLSPWGEELVRSAGVRLGYTAQRYPHIVNRLAVLWHDTPALVRYIDGLIMDDRPQRQGFEFQALDELTGLKNIRLAQRHAVR